MNIACAKEQIKNAMKAYFTKDEFGNFLIPVEAQRPVFLMGPPGIGKTAIMKQIANELNVALVSYSMTHHTRQSALGLPLIVEKTYGGQTFSISEYTMSEIIASVYEVIEKTGKQEGILFLDEINCVSETLAPSMLQFLQQKTFGKHAVPNGWIVVTAGNPPEYNNSVRDFDIVTRDRLKHIDVTADFDAWKAFAVDHGVHGAVMSYLESKKGNFYRIESTVDGKTFVTARGWTDLSDMLHLYEHHDLPVDYDLVAQYLQNRQVAKDFANFYYLYQQYKRDLQMQRILDGEEIEAVLTRASKASFDEKLSIMGLLTDLVNSELRTFYQQAKALEELANAVRNVGVGLGTAKAPTASDLLNAEILKNQKKLLIAKESSSLSHEQQMIHNITIKLIEEFHTQLLAKKPGTPKAIYDFLKQCFYAKREQQKKDAQAIRVKLANAFRFTEKAFGDGNEMLLLVTNLTVSYYGFFFICHFGCDEYYKHNKKMQTHERRLDILNEIDKINLNTQLTDFAF